MTHEERIEIKKMIDDAITARIGNVAIANAVMPPAFIPTVHCSHSITAITTDGKKMCVQCGTDVSDLYTAQQ